MTEACSPVPVLQEFEALEIRALCPGLQGQSIAIDGKGVRGSHEAGQEMAHIVSAWHVQREVMQSPWGVT